MAKRMGARIRLEKVDHTPLRPGARHRRDLRGGGDLCSVIQLAVSATRCDVGGPVLSGPLVWLETVTVEQSKSNSLKEEPTNG